jgi:hypothetical protein
MKVYGGVDVYVHILLTSALAGGEWSASRPGSLTPGVRTPGAHWIEGSVDPRTTLGRGEEKILDRTGTRTPTLGRPARRHSRIPTAPFRLAY